MRINSSYVAPDAVKTLANHARSKAKASQEAARSNSTGQGENAAGLAISQQLRQNIQGLTAASRRTQDSVSLVQTAQTALGESEGVLERMSDLANRAMNAPEDQAATDQEFQALKERLDEIADTAAFNGQKLLDGSFSPSGSEVIPVELRGMGAVDLGLDDQSLASGDIARTALKVVESAVNMVSAMRAQLGEAIGKMENELNSINTTIENQQAADSHIRDADYGRQAANLAAREILDRASSAMRAQGNINPKDALKLLENE